MVSDVLNLGFTVPADTAFGTYFFHLLPFVERIIHRRLADDIADQCHENVDPAETLAGIVDEACDLPFVAQVDLVHQDPAA